jgi:nitroreductase
MTDRDALDAIARRRSVITQKPDRPDQATIRQLLEAAIRAPNHHQNEPWRFIVLAGKARERLGDLFADIARAKPSLPEGIGGDAVVEAERRKPLRGPVVIVVASVKNDHPKALPIEDVEATAAAVENLLIAAEALGLAAAWRTGEHAYDDRVKEHLGLRPADVIVGFVYVGYPAAAAAPATPRTPVDQLTRWDGWEE